MTAITEEQLATPAIYQYIFKLVGEEGIETLRRWADPERNQIWLEAKLSNEAVKGSDRARFEKESELEPEDFRNTEKSDEEIAEITEIPLNTVRHTLYNLYEHRIAEYRRIKNSETGWLTYLWVMKMENIEQVLRVEMDFAKTKLTAKLNYDEANDFYQCKDCGITITFNEAMGNNFECQQCGKQMVHFDDELLVNAIKKRIDNMKSALDNA